MGLNEIAVPVVVCGHVKASGVVVFMFPNAGSYRALRYRGGCSTDWFDAYTASGIADQIWWPQYPVLNMAPAELVGILPTHTAPPFIHT